MPLRHSGPVHPATATPVQHLVVMGVSGSGKTTLAQTLADRLGWACAEADDFHPQANVDRKTAGVALTDEDREPWLRTIRDWLTEQTRAGHAAVVTCSALKVAYRDVLRAAQGTVRFVHLTAPPEVIGERLTRRTGHFMPATLLGSQLETLEPLTPDEDGITLVVDRPPAVLADEVVRAFDLKPDAEPAPGAQPAPDAHPGRGAQPAAGAQPALGAQPEPGTTTPPS